jgi:hypothetical protein
MLYNIEEKAPLVAEPSHRLKPLELSRSRRDSGGAHTVIEVLAGALDAVAAGIGTNAASPALVSMRGYYLQRRRQRRKQRLRRLRSSMRRQRLVHLRLPPRLRLRRNSGPISSPPFSEYALLRSSRASHNRQPVASSKIIFPLGEIFEIAWVLLVGSELPKTLNSRNPPS